MSNFIVSIKKHKVAIISTIIFWLFAELFLIAPIAITIVDSNSTGVFNFTYFVENIITNIVQVAGPKKMFGVQYLGTLGSATLFFTIFMLICLGIGMWKGRSKGE